MVKIRLARHGKRNSPFYRIVAIEEAAKRGGAPIDILGFWFPEKDQKEVNKKRIDEWVKKGAQVTPAVEKLLKTK